MNSPDVGLIGHYDFGKVGVSLLLGLMGAYCAIELGARVSAARGPARIGWLAGGALAMGIGTWSMHFMGMFAFILPIPVRYDWPTTLLSFAASFFASLAALTVASGAKMNGRRAVAGSVFMGAGISGLHYLAMASMRMDAIQHYSPPLVTISVLISILLSFVSIQLMFAWRQLPAQYTLRKVLSVLLLGAAISAMHYIAMAAVAFQRSAEFCDISHAMSVSSLGILGIAAANVVVIVVVALTSATDRVQRHRALLDELFEQTPDPVALLEADQRIVRVNREFTRVFGYTMPESVGRKIGELIAPAHLREDEERQTGLAVEGQRVDTEGVCVRKDGTPLDVAIIRAPVSIAPGKILLYAIYRDITESRRAQEALRRSHEQLHMLSRRIFTVQEEERRHLARELHDEMSQALTAAKINLQFARDAENAAEGRRRMDDSLSILDQLLRRTSELSLDLRSPLLDDLGWCPRCAGISTSRPSARVSGRSFSAISHPSASAPRSRRPVFAWCRRRSRTSRGTPGPSWSRSSSIRPRERCTSSSGTMGLVSMCPRRWNAWIASATSV